MPLETKREIADALLRDLFARQSRILIADAVRAGAERGVSRTTLRRAATAMGVREVHNGPLPGFWEVDK